MMPASTTFASNLATIGGASSDSDDAMTDVAKKAKILLGVLFIVGTAATDLTVVKDKIVSGAPPSRRDVTDLNVIISSMNILVNRERTAAEKVSPVPRLLRAYNIRIKSSEEKVLCPSTKTKPQSLSDEMWTLKCFTNGDPRENNVAVAPPKRGGR